MGFLNKLVDAFFKKTPATTNITKREPADWETKWRQENEEKAKEAEKKIGPWIVEKIQQHSVLNFTWESGGDEGFVTFEKETGAEENEFMELSEYIINKLEIPDAGEFEMLGEGKLYIEAGQVKASYQSTTNIMVDFDEENEKEIWGEPEHEEENRVLFNV